jgi:hypothetical protein
MQDFSQKANFRSHIQGFPIIYLRKMPKRSGEGRKPGFENNLQTKYRGTDRQDKALEIENNRQTLVSVKDAMIKRTTIPIRCDGEHDHGVLRELNQPRSTRQG